MEMKPKKQTIKGWAVVDKKGELCSVSIGINYDNTGVKNYAVYEESAKFILKHYKAKVVKCRITLLP
jgi:hypothetical protein